MTELKFSIEDLRQMIHDAVQEAVEDAIEDLVALSSPTFLESIVQSREEALRGQVTSLDSLPRG